MGRCTDTAGYEGVRAGVEFKCIATKCVVYGYRRLSGRFTRCQDIRGGDLRIEATHTSG